MKKYFLAFVMLCMAVWLPAAERKKMNFNQHWLLKIGDIQDAQAKNYNDSQWQPVTLPYAFNGNEAYRKDIEEHTDTVAWYRKHFCIDHIKGKKVFIEFEGVRQAADIYLNGKHVGYSENGVMACGFDLTPYITEGENVIAVR